MTIRELHNLAMRQGFPRGEVHEILHDMAAMAFGVKSLCECNPEQLSHLASSVRAHSAPRNTAAPVARKPRPRSGRPQAAGVVRMATPKQRSFMMRLFCELGWSRSARDGFLKTHLGVDSIDQITTIQDASKAINMLIGFKRKRDGAERRRYGT